MTKRSRAAEDGGRRRGSGEKKQIDKARRARDMERRIQGRYKERQREAESEVQREMVCAPEKLRR